MFSLLIFWFVNYFDSLVYKLPSNYYEWFKWSVLFKFVTLNDNNLGFFSYENPMFFDLLFSIESEDNLKF